MVEEIGRNTIGWWGYNWDIYLHSTKIKNFNPSMFLAKYGYLHIPFGTKSTFIENNPDAVDNFHIIDDIGAVNCHTVTYMIDGEIYEIVVTKHGTTIETISEPTKEGYTFSGWGEVPETMPASDVTISGSFIINQYTVTYVIDGEVFATDTITYGENITLPDVPVKEGHDFAWTDEIPKTMPAKDIVINGSYTTGILNAVVEEDVLYIYTTDGQRVNELRKGINIVLLKDGSIRKIFVNN